MCLLGPVFHHLLIPTGQWKAINHICRVVSDADCMLSPQTEGVPYMEQNHLHKQRWEFCIWNNAQKMKENDVKKILFSLAYLTPIKLPFCMSTGERKRLKKKNQNPSKTMVMVKENEIKDLYSPFRCKETSKTAVRP